jgi:hypothetical protein
VITNCFELLAAIAHDEAIFASDMSDDIRQAVCHVRTSVSTRLPNALVLEYEDMLNTLRRDFPEQREGVSAGLVLMAMNPRKLMSIVILLSRMPP